MRLEDVGNQPPQLHQRSERASERTREVPRQGRLNPIRFLFVWSLFSPLPHRFRSGRGLAWRTALFCRLLPPTHSLRLCWACNTRATPTQPPARVRAAVGPPARQHREHHPIFLSFFLSLFDRIHDGIDEGTRSLFSTPRARLRVRGTQPRLATGANSLTTPSLFLHSLLPSSCTDRFYFP